MPRVSESDAKALLAMQAELKRLATKIDNFRGDGVVNNRWSMSIAQVRGGNGGRGQSDDGLFPVTLTQTGGSAGDKTTQCTFSYTVKDYTGTNTLATATGMTGNGQRVVNAQMTAGTYGLAYYDGRTLKLIWADERFDQTNCT